MPLPRRRSLESSRRRRREKRQSREDPAASMYSPTNITAQQMPGSYSADSPQQQQQPYQPPPQQQQQQQQQQQPPYQPSPPSQQQPYSPQQYPPQQYPPQQFPSQPYQQQQYEQHQQHQQHQLYQQKFQESFPQPTSLPMPQQATPPHDALQPRSRASSGSLSSANSSSSSYLEISRQYPSGRYGGFFSAFMKAPSERRRRRRRGSGTKKRRGVFFNGGNNSSLSSVNSDLAYGTGFVKKDKDKSTHYSSSVAGSTVSGAQPQQYPGAVSGRRSPKRLNEKKRDKTDEEILAIGRQLSDLARQSNEEDLRAAGKIRPSGLASAAAAITALRKSRRDGKKRGLSNSKKKHRDSSSDESDWESASDDDGDSSESSSSDESALHLAYGGNESSRSNVALAGAAAAAAGAVAASAAESYQTTHRPTTHRRKSSVVDPRLFGPVNSLRGLVHTPCGFGDEQQPAPSSTGSGRHSLNRYDNDRPATGESQADSAHRPGSVPLEQPIPMVPVSNKVFEAGSRDSRNSYRRQRSNEESLDPTLSGGVAAAAAAAAARMSDRRGPWTEDRIYRDDVKRTRPDADEDYFQRDQAPFEELERRRENPEVYYNRRNDDVDSPRSEATRQMPDYFNKDAPGMSKESRSWMELHPQERKETLRYQTTHDVHMERREAELREEQRQQEREQQQQQQQQQQSTRTTKAGDGNIERPTQPASNSDIDPFKYQVADDAFNTPQFNTPRRPLTPQVVTVERVPNFAESSQPPSSGRQPTRPDIRLSRKDTYDIQMAEEERRRGNDSGSRHRDPRDGHGYEEEEREARSILDEAKRSTIPVAAVAVASAIAVEEERSRERRRRDYSDDGSRDRSRPHKDVVQEEADKYYRESVIARKIASDEIRSQSKSPDGSVVDKWDTPPVEEHINIVTPPNMEGKEHEDDDPYGAPNADVKIDNEIFPYETDKFRATRGSDAPRFRSKDPSCERERPLLNIVRPTPVPSPDSMAAARRGPEQPTEVPASRDVHEEESLVDSSEDEEAEPKGEATQSSPTGKSVSWGQNEINRFVVESPEARSRAESPNELAEAEEKPRPRLSKSSRWGKIAAVIAAGTAEPISELDRNTEPGSRDLPADGDASSAPGSEIPDPEPEQMPGSFDDEEFAATVAAGLEKTGFNPNIVIDDPAFRRRNSRPETNETPMPASDTQRDEQRAREEIEVEGDLSLTDTEDEHDEKTQKQNKVNALERYLQRRQSGEIRPPSQLQESVQPPTVEERPVTPPQKSNSEQRKVLEAFLQKRQSGEIKPPREVLEAREPRDLELTSETATGPVHESEPERPPIRKLEPEALRELEENASDYEPPAQLKKKKKKKRRDPDDENSKLSIPGDEATEISRISVPGDEATVFSVEDWEDWDSSPGASTRRSLLAGSEMSISSRRSARLRRPRSSTFDLPETNGSEHPGDDRVDDRGVSSVVSEPHDEERKPRSRDSKSLRHNDNSEKHVSSRKPRKVSGNKKPGLFSGIFNKPGGKNDRTDVIDEKRGSFFEQADTLGAGVGPASLAAAAAMALNRSNAADVSSEPENISRELSGSNQEFNDHYPVIAPRAIAIDPQYRDLLPLPPSEPGSPVESDFGGLPGLPDSRPASPIEDRDRRFDKIHRRQRSNQDLAASARNRSYSNTAVPLAALLRGIGSGPPSPVANKPPRTPPRPTSWDSTKEFMPLMLLEHSRRGSLDRSVKSEELPPLPPSEVTSEAEGEDIEDFRTPMPYPNDDFRLRLQTEGLPAERAVASGESEGSTPKADLTYELPARPTDNDRRFTDDYETAPVKSTSSSGQSARTVDAQAIPSPTTPTRRRSPQKDAYLRPDELTSADASDDFETARTSPADMHDEDLYEPELPPIEPSMLGAIPEFSRPAKFFEDKVPDHSALATMDRVIETLPSNESVPEDQTRQGSRSYPDLQSEAAEESSDKGKKYISSDERSLYMQPSAEETAATFVEVPEMSFNKGFGSDVEYNPSTESLSKDFTEEKALAPEMIPRPVTVEDESEPENHTLEPEFESIAEEIPVFEPADEDVEVPYTESVDIIPVSDELLSDTIAESTQRSQPEEVEEIIVGTIPKAAPHSVPEAPVQEYPKNPDVSTVIEDSDESEEEEESDEEEDSDDSEDSEDSDEEEDEEEQRHVEVAKHFDEDGNAIRDMAASIDSLGAASVVSSGSKKNKKKKNKKKKKKKRKRKKKSKTAAAAAAAATAAALAAAEASNETNALPATESTKPSIAPAVDSITETAPSDLRNSPTELERSEVEPAIGPSIEPTPADTMEVTEETPLGVAKDFVASEPVNEAPEQTLREIAEESTIEKTQEAAATAEPETTTLAETEERRDIPSGAIENASEEADDLAKWAATDSEPIPHSDHRGERESSPLEDKATVVEELVETLLPSQEEASVPDIESQLSTEEPAGESAGQEHHDVPVEDRDALVADVVLPTEEETPIEPPATVEELVAPETEDSHTSYADELASVPQDASPAGDRDWAGDDVKEQDSEEVVADQDFEQTSPMPFELPTIMEEPLEDANATESDDFEQTEQDAPTYSDQLSPILEETMEDLLEESAPAEISEPVSLGEDIESKPEPEEDKPIYETDQTEERPDTQDAEETKALEPPSEQHEATAAIEDVVSTELKMDETSSRSIDEVAETMREKDTDRPPQLPSFASDISEPLFTQGDAPSEYPTQQSPASYEPTQMDGSFVIPEESARLPADEQTESTEAIEVPAVLDTVDEVETEPEGSKERSADAPDIVSPVEEAKEIDEQESTETPDLGLPEPELKEAESPAEEEKNDEQTLEPTEPTLEPEVTPDESVEIPSLETDHQTPADTVPETREIASADESRETGEQQPDTEKAVRTDSAPDADLAEVAPEESSQDNAAVEQPAGAGLELDVVPQEDTNEPGSALPEELETKDEDSIPLKESETVPPQELDENANLEPKPDQDANDDGLRLPVDNTDLETENSGDQLREADADVAKSAIPLETGPAEDSRSTHEEELQPEVEGNEYGNVDGQTEEEKANNSEQSVEVVDSTNTLDATEETSLPQESNMTSELEQPTLEAEIEASPVTLPNVDEQMEPERLTRAEESEHLELTQDGDIAPASTVPETASEEVERAPEAKDGSTEASELQEEVSLEPQEGKPQADEAMTEPTSDGQERSVAENLSQIETPAEGARGDTVDTTLTNSDLAADASYIPLLDKEEEAPGKILSHPLDIFESDIPDAPNPITIGVEDAEAEAADKNLTEEKEKPSEEQILSHPLDIFESDIHNTPNPIDITVDDAEAAEKGLTEEKFLEERAVTEDETKSEDLQLESVQAEERQPESTSEARPEPTLEESQEERTSEIVEEPQLKEPHAETSDENKHESESRELHFAGSETIHQVDEATQENTTTEETIVLQKDKVEPAAELEQLPPFEAICQPTEEQPPTERIKLPEFTFPAKPAEAVSRTLTEDSVDPLDPVPQRPSSSYRQEVPPRKSTFLLAPPEPDHGETSASEYGDSDSDSDSDNDTSTIISDTASLRGSIRRSRYPRHSESTSSLTGFEVTGTPYAEQHAHRATRSKKKKGKKKKQKHKHKRKKSTAGSEPSSSHNSLGEPTGQGDGANNNPPPPHPEREAPPPPPQREAPLPPSEINFSEPTTAPPEALEKVEPEPRELVGSDSAENKPSEPAKPSTSQQREDAKNGDASLAPILEEVVAEESANADSKPANEPEPEHRDVPATAAPAAPLEDESENPWDLFTNKWEKHGSATQSQEELLEGHVIEDASFVDEPSAISTPQRRNSQTEQQIIPGNVDNGAEPSSEEHGDKQDPSVSSPGSSTERSIRPSSASSQGSERSNRPWFTGISGSVSLMAERFGGAKKPTRDKDKDPIPPDRDPIPLDKEDPKDQSFLGNPAPRKSGDERSWQINQVQTIDDFLESGNGPTTPNKRKKRQSQPIRPSTPKRSESISEVISPDFIVGKKLRRRDGFRGERVGSADIEEATELLESLGPFELLRRSSQAGNPMGGLLREANASEISVLPPMELSEFSDYETSDYRLSPPRTLPSVEELPEPEAEAEATASEVGFYRDSSFSGSIPSRSRRHSTSTIHIGDDEEKMRDSGVDGDWIEAAIAKLKTPEPVNRAPDRPLKRRLRRSTLGGQRLGETSLRDAAQDPEKKTIPGTRERVLTGTGTRPETPTGRSSPTRKGYGAIAGMGIAPRRLSTISPIPSLSDRSDTPPMLRRAATSFSFSPMAGPLSGPSPPVAGPLRSLRRAVSAQIAPGLQRPESPALKAILTEPQPRSVSDSQIPSATRAQPDPARADPSNGPAPQSPPNSGAMRQRTPERRKLSPQADAVSGSTVRSSSIPTPGLRRADKRGSDLRSLRQQNTSSNSIAPSEVPVANEGRVRAKDKTDVFDGLGEGQFGSPRSPTRPHSMRRRQSMQVLELEARVEQLIAENRLLSDARHSSEQHLSHRVVTALSDRDTQIEALNQRLKFLKGEVSRLTEVNEGLTSANAELANKDNSRYADLQVYADRDGNDAALMQVLHEKDAQIADLTTKLDAAKERIRELQRQILESKAADVQFLNIKDEDYFDHRCQQLCSHVQQWVLRFSKFSDMRACRLTNEINDEKIIDRLDNAVLDGSDVDRYLNDRVRRRDIFMSMSMNMIWEFVFTRYLFGMDREQRQKLKSLEKLLTEVGPAQAVRQWRAVTLTLLSKRDSFKRQRDLDTEAVVQAIYQTLCKVLPPPSNLEGQIQAQLRRVMHEAVHLSIEMRTQKAEYMMLPPLQPEYDADGELVQTVQFNASMMSERSGTLKLTNEELEARGAIVRVVLFPLVVKKGDDDGSNDEEIVICPAQVLIARSKLTRQPTPSDGGRASTGTGRLSGGTNSPDTRQANAV
ncbi:hypothetical protein ACHAPV_007801 [Trichoderma viride]